MQHIDEHTIELFVLGSELVKDRRDEIDAHFRECHGCRLLAEQIEQFYRRADEGMMSKTEHAEKDISTSLARRRQEMMAYYEPYSLPARFMSNTLIGRMGNFIRRHPLVAGVGGLSFAAALVMLGMMLPDIFKQPEINIITDYNPTYHNYNTATDVLEVLNDGQQTLWMLKSHNIAREKKNEDDHRSRKTIIMDLDANGMNEVITGLPLVKYPDENDVKSLFVFKSDGTLLWSKRFAENVNYLDRLYYSPYFNVHAVLGLRSSDSTQSQIVVAANHFDRSPSVIYRLDAGGNILGSYRHFGSIMGLYQYDLDGDGTHEIIICGKNDTGDTTKTEFGSIAVLDPMKIIDNKRSTTCPGYRLPPSDAELYYVKIPHVDFELHSHNFGAIKKMEGNDSSKLKFLYTHTDEGWSFDFFFDYEMHVLGAKSYDFTDALHKRLVTEGKLSGNIDSRYLENLKQGVRYWDGEKWQIKPTRIKHNKNYP